MSHVFLFYVQENRVEAERLAQALAADGVNVWIDREQIQPGQRWQQAIRRAIEQGTFFLACFSAEYGRRSKTYMNEELTLAIDQLRQHPRSRACDNENAVGSGFNN